MGQDAHSRNCSRQNETYRPVRSTCSIALANSAGVRTTYVLPFAAATIC